MNTHEPRAGMARAFRETTLSLIGLFQVYEVEPDLAQVLAPLVVRQLLPAVDRHRDVDQHPLAAPVASFAVYGTGCMGSGGLPILTAQGSSLPRSASTFDTQVINLPAGGGFAFMVLGFDNTSWNGLPLPLDLTSFGMPGCTGYVRVDAAVLVPQVSGTLSFSMAIPGGLEGIVFHQQCLSLDPAAGNPAGAATSNAGTAVVGN